MSATAGGSSSAGEAVRDLVHRAVAADDDEQPRAAGRRLARELPELAAALADEGVALEPAAAARCAISGQRRPVDPFAAAGLTRKTVPSSVTVWSASSVISSTALRMSSSLIRRNSPSTIDVADDQHAACLDLPQRAEREEHRRLHLDGEDAAVGPAAASPGSGW